MSKGNIYREKAGNQGKSSFYGGDSLKSFSKSVRICLRQLSNASIKPSQPFSGPISVSYTTAKGNNFDHFYLLDRK
jgi:hypothetical protein